MRTLEILPIMVVFIFIAPCISLFAQDSFDDFIKDQDKVFEQLQKESEKEFERIQKVDAEFAEILSRAWKELELNTGIDPDPTPKPEKIPVAKPSEVPEPTPPPEEPEEVKPEVEPKITPPESPKPKVEIKQIQVPAKEGEPLSVEFFDTRLRVYFDKRLKQSIGETISESTISKFWETLSTCKYQPLVQQVIDLKERLGLNDWGYCILLDAVSEGIYGQLANERLLFSWFMLVKSGYNARVGFYGRDVYLLLPSLNTVFGTPYYVLDNKNFFLTFLGTPKRELKSLYTYEGSYQDAQKLIDFNMYRSLDISKSASQKKFTFTYKNKTYNLSLNVNKNMINFFESYPQTNLNVYFRAAMSSEIAHSLLEGLRPIIKDKSESEAVNILLRFVQSAFAYKTDDSQFGEEKYLFSEETLFYPYSDCEDRSILFSFLVKNLLGLEVIGLDYPGHIATAVYFNTNVDGDSIHYNNKKYIICDPTYLYADYGECMPKFKNVTPEIITMN